MKNAVLILAVILLISLPLFIYKPAEKSFSGTDDSAKVTIEQIQPGYKPWFKPLWQPPSGEVATLLFCLQAAIGAGFIGYYIGFARGRAKTKRETANDAHH